MSGGDLDVAPIDAGVEHGGHGGVPEQVWVQPHDRGTGEVVRTSGGAVPIHSPVSPVEQDRTSPPVIDSLVKGPANSGKLGHQRFFAAFAVDEQDAVPMFLAKGFRDMQPEEAEHRDQGEVELPVGDPILSS